MRFDNAPLRQLSFQGETAAGSVAAIGIGLRSRGYRPTGPSAKRRLRPRSIARHPTTNIAPLTATLVSISGAEIRGLVGPVVQVTVYPLTTSPQANVRGVMLPVPCLDPTEPGPRFTSSTGGDLPAGPCDPPSGDVCIPLAGRPLRFGLTPGVQTKGALQVLSPATLSRLYASTRAFALAFAPMRAATNIHLVTEYILRSSFFPCRARTLARSLSSDGRSLASHNCQTVPVHASLRVRCPEGTHHR